MLGLRETGLLRTRVAADGGFSIVDDVTFNGSTTTPIDTRYGGKFKPACSCAERGLCRSLAWWQHVPPGFIAAAARAARLHYRRDHGGVRGVWGCHLSGHKVMVATRLAGSTACAVGCVLSCCRITCIAV